MVEQTTQTNRCQTIWSLIQSKHWRRALPPQMRARPVRPQTETHTSWPAMQSEISQRPISSRAAADRSQSTGQLTGGLIPGAPPSLAPSQHEPPPLSWQPVLWAYLAQTHVHGESDIDCCSVCHRASKNSCLKLAETKWSHLITKCTLSKS